MNSLKGLLCFVEDDPGIRELVEKGLRMAGYGVDSFENAETAASLLGHDRWNLFIIDVMLPGAMSGLDLCRMIRQSKGLTPILILSALSEPNHRIEGLKIGADDYLNKPFEMEELILRVEGLLKRSRWYHNHLSSYSWAENQIVFDSFEGSRAGSRFELSHKECQLMKLLIEKKDSVVTRDEILDRVWGPNSFPSVRTVDNFIVKLRKYFEPDPNHPRYIQSIRGVGYKFSDKGDACTP